MSIITWVENGKKQFAVFESKYFDQSDGNIPVYESRHKTVDDIRAFSDDEIVMVSGDRKRYRILQPIKIENSSPEKRLPVSRPRKRRSRKIA